jgi:hypothetical protein
MYCTEDQCVPSEAVQKELQHHNSFRPNLRFQLFKMKPKINSLNAVTFRTNKIKGIRELR